MVSGQWSGGRGYLRSEMEFMRSKSSLSYCLLPTFSLLLFLNGCNIMSALAYKTMGPNKIPAEYTPLQEPTLVLAESYGKANDLQPYADQLGNLVAKELTAHKVAPLVDDSKLMALRGEKANGYDKMKIPDVGRAVGAKQIIYIDLRQCGIETVPGSDMFQGSIEANVRVVDVSTGQTRWPDVGDSHPFKSKTEFTRRDARDSPLAVRNLMLEDLAAAISRLFYEVKPEFEGGKNEPN